MKIISKVKDYYDYISYVYGMDEKYIYVRNFSTIPNVSGNHITIPHDYSIPSLRYEMNDTYWIAVCGKLFPIKLHTIISERIEHSLSLIEKVSNSRYTRYSYKITPGIFNQKIFDAQVQLKAPIAILHEINYDHINVYNSSPLLGNIVNFVNHYPAEKIWQDIYYFLANQCNNPNADLNPPASISDKYKLIEKGFDPVISFRKRK